MERRTFLSAGTASVLPFTYGFSSITGDSGPTGPVDIVREYYRRASVAESVNEFANQIPELAHSVSPLPTVAASIPRVFDGVLGQELVDVEVVEEDIGEERIRDLSDFFAGSVDGEEVETIAENNAIVAVTLESEAAIGGVLAVEWLVAPEDDEWRLVWFDDRKSPEAAAREFFRQVTLAESLGALDDPVAERSHSASPLVNVAEYTPWYFRGLRRQELVQTHLVAENISSDEIASQFTPLLSWASRDEIGAIAEKNAVVALSLSDEYVGVSNFRQRWLMAPEDGEWRLVWF